jgi:hypothetical protein
VSGRAAARRARNIRRDQRRSVKGWEEAEYETMPLLRDQTPSPERNITGVNGD